MKFITFNIEANGLIHNASDIWYISLKDHDTKETKDYGHDSIQEAIEILQTADRLVTHNGMCYDCPVVCKLFDTWLPPTVDTVLISRLIYPDIYTHPAGGNALSDWAPVLGMPIKTDQPDWTFNNPDLKDHGRYNVELTFRLFHYFRRFFTKEYEQSIKLEHDFAKCMAMQMMNGYTLDVDATQELLQTTHIHHAEAMDSLNKMIPPIVEEMKTPQYWIDPNTNDKYVRKGDAPSSLRKSLERGPNKIKLHPFKPGSGQMIADHFISKYNWKPEKITAAGNPVTDVKVLESLEYPEASIILDARMYKNKMDDAQGWLDHLQPNGRVHGNINTNGTVTGRCSHSSPNMGNIPKVQRPLGYECRRCWIPRPDWVQVGADASGLEDRMLAHCLRPFDGGSYESLVLHGDAHQYRADLLSEGLGFEVTRDIQKTIIYAKNYGARDAKLGSIVGRDPSCGAEIRRLLDTGIEGMAELLSSLTEEVERYGYLIGLDGRHLPVRREDVVLNTKLQSYGAVIMKKAVVLYHEQAIRLYDQHGRRWAYLVNVHDEQQFESEPTIAEAIGSLFVQSITQAGIELGIDTPLSGEYKIGNNWAECH